MIVCYVRHEKSARLFLFTIDFELFCLERICVGDKVVCDKKYGDKLGEIVAAIEMNPEEAEVVVKTSNAYWPLRKIIRKYVPPVITSIDEVPEKIIEIIRDQERRKLIDKLNSAELLPFDV